MDLNTRIVITTKDQTQAGNASVISGQERVAVSAKKVNDAFKVLDIRPFRLIQQEIKQVEAAYKRLATSGKVSGAQLNRAANASRQRVRQLKLEMAGLNNAAQLLPASFAAAFSFAGLVLGTRAIVDATVKMDGYRNALLAATGTQDAAADSLQFVRDEARRLGIDLNGAVSGYVKLAAASKGTRIEGQQTRDVFSAVAEASRVLNLSTEATNGAINAVSQIMSKGKLSAEELRQQLGERLPGSFQIAARAMGVTTAELDKMLAQGEIISDEFLPKFAAELRNTFGDGLEQAVNGPAASFNRLNTALFEMKVALGESGIVDALAAVAEVLTALLGVIGDLTPASKLFLGVMAGMGTAALVWTFGLSQVVAVFRAGLIPALTGATIGSRALSIAMRAIPIIGGALLAIELGRWLYGLATGSDSAAESQKKLAEESEKVKAKLQQSVQTLREQAGAYRGLAAASDEALSRALLANQRSRDEAIRAIQNQQRATKDAEQSITQVVVDAAQERSQILDDHLQDKLALIAAATEREVSAAEVAGASTRDVLEKANAAKIDVYKAYEKEVEKTLQSLLRKEADHAKNVQEVHEQIIDHDRDVQKTLRELEGKTLTEAQKNAEKLKEIREKRAAAEQAIEQENFEQGSKLALEAEQLAEDHARNQRQRVAEGNAYEFEAIAAKKEFVETAELASSALQKLKESEQNQAEAAAESAQEQKDKLEEVQQTIVDINQQIAEQKLLKIQVNDDQVQAAIQRINAIPATKTITIIEKRVQANQLGGPIHRNDGGFIPRAGKLDGFGGGDRVRALLEPGEFIIRKEAVQKYGSDFMARVNAMKEPLKQRVSGADQIIRRRLGGIIPRFASGGLARFSGAGFGAGTGAGGALLGGRLALTLDIDDTELTDALTQLETKILEQVEDAQQRFNDSALQVTERAADLSSRAIERFSSELERIQKNASRFDDSIEDRIRRIQREGFTEEEKRVDIIKQIREKQAAAEEAIAQGDVERATRLNQEIIALAEQISVETRDAAGNIIVDQQTAANQAIGFLRQAQTLGKQIAAEESRQLELAKQAELAAIELEQSEKLAAIEVERQAKLAAIEEAKQAELASIRETDAARSGSYSSTSSFGRSSGDRSYSRSGSFLGSNGAPVKSIQTQAAEIQRQIDLLQSSLGNSSTFGNDGRSSQLITQIQNLQRQKQQLLTTGSTDGAQVLAGPIIGIRKEVDNTSEMLAETQSTLNDISKQLQYENRTSVRTGLEAQQDYLQKKLSSFSGYNTGGAVPGSGNEDTVPAMLTPGEHVIKKASVAKYGRRFIEAINQGVIPPQVVERFSAAVSRGVLPQNFATGGPVRSAGAGNKVVESVELTLNVGAAQARGLFPNNDATRDLIAELKDAGLVGG